jgi:hypothetical protein
MIVRNLLKGELAAGKERDSLFAARFSPEQEEGG